MRRSIAVPAFALAASACAVIAGLDDPSIDAPDADASVDGRPSEDATNGDSATDGGPGADADAGRKCTGTVLKTDNFDDRTNDASGGWTTDYLGDGGVIQIVDGGLHIDIPPVTTKVNARRQLEVSKPAAKRMCVSFTISPVKPTTSTLSSYFDAGDTTYSFIAMQGPDASTYTGLLVDGEGLSAYVVHDDGGETKRPLMLPLATKLNVVFDADFVANEVFIVVNGKEEKLTMIRPAPAPTAMFALGIRNLGPTPEAEATFDDVLVTAE